MSKDYMSVIEKELEQGINRMQEQYKKAKKEKEKLEKLMEELQNYIEAYEKFKDEFF